MSSFLSSLSQVRFYGLALVKKSQKLTPSSFFYGIRNYAIKVPEGHKMVPTYEKQRKKIEYEGETRDAGLENLKRFRNYVMGRIYQKKDQMDEKRPIEEVFAAPQRTAEEATNANLARGETERAEEIDEDEEYGLRPVAPGTQRFSISKSLERTAKLNPDPGARNYERFYGKPLDERSTDDHLEYKFVPYYEQSEPYEVCKPGITEEDKIKYTTATELVLASARTHWEHMQPSILPPFYSTGWQYTEFNPPFAML